MRRRALLAALAAAGSGGCLSRLNDVDGDGVPDADDPAPFDASRPRDDRTTPRADDPGSPGSDDPPTARSEPRDPDPSATDAPDRTDGPVVVGQIERVSAPPDDAPRVWPIGTDASDGRCRDANADASPATGEGAASWFVYGGCGSRKVFSATPGERLLLRATTDNGVLVDAAFRVEDRIDGEWVRRGVSLDPLGPDAAETFAYVPQGDRVRVVNIDRPQAEGVGFYLRVFRG